MIHHLLTVATAPHPTARPRYSQVPQPASARGAGRRSAHTSRPTLAAYEHGTKSPTLATTQRLLAAAGYRLDIAPVPRFRVATD